MIKVLESAIEKVKRLPEDRQAYAAHVLEEIAADGTPFAIPDEHRAAVLEGRDQARRGEVVDEDTADRLLRKPWA